MTAGAADAGDERVPRTVRKAVASTVRRGDLKNLDIMLLFLQTECLDIVYHMSI